MVRRLTQTDVFYVGVIVCFAIAANIYLHYWIVCNSGGYINKAFSKTA